MGPLPPALEAIVNSLVEYARIFHHQTDMLSLEPTGLFKASHDASTRCHLPPLPNETTQEHLQRLSNFCNYAPTGSAHARVRVLNAAAGCTKILQQDLLETLTIEERLLVLEKYDKIMKADAALAGRLTPDIVPPQYKPYDPRSVQTNGAKNTPPPTTRRTPTCEITRGELVSFVVDPSILVGRKFTNPATDEVIEILDFGIKLRAGQVLDVAVSGAHVPVWTATLPVEEVKNMLIKIVAL